MTTSGNNTDSNNQANNLNLTSEQETNNENNISPLTGSAILNFITSGEGIAVLVGGLILIVLVGVILIKHKPPKWKRN